MNRADTTPRALLDLTIEQRQIGNEHFSYREGSDLPSPEALYFTETGHYLNGIFREYWASNPADNPGWANAPEFYFRHAEEYQRVLRGLGMEGNPVWFIEMGSPTPSTSEDYAYGEWMTEELQAQYLERAFEIVRTEWPWVEMVFVWHLNAAPYAGPDSKFAGFSITDEHANPRPAFRVIQEFVTAGYAEIVQ